MKKKDYILVPIAITAIIYLVFAFSLWNMDASEWSESSRVFCVFLGLFLSVVAIVAMEVEK